MSTENETNIKTSVSLIPHYVERMDELVKKKTFPSRSSIINLSLGEFFGHMDERNKEKLTESNEYIKKAFDAFLESDEGKECIRKTLGSKK